MERTREKGRRECEVPWLATGSCARVVTVSAAPEAGRWETHSLTLIQEGIEFGGDEVGLGSGFAWPG